jgi:hypothetical protein
VRGERSIDLGTPGLVEWEHGSGEVRERDSVDCYRWCES